MDYIEVENKGYVLATSSLADQRTMVLKHGESFGIFDWHGDIYQIGAGTQGVYHNGTRFLSRMELRVNGMRPLLLSSAPREDNQVLVIDLTNPELRRDAQPHIKQDNVHIQRLKFLWQSRLHERIHIRNYGLERARFELRFHFDADFSDIFEIRGIRRSRRGYKFPVRFENGIFVFAYEGLDTLTRRTLIRLTPAPHHVEQETAKYELDLAPRQEIALEIEAGFLEDQQDVVMKGFEEARADMNFYMERTGAHWANVLTSHDEFNDWIDQARSDLITMISQTPHGPYPYAGVPWFSTAFGRDGIITALETLWAEPEVARGVLNYLAKTQAEAFDDFQDAEPGKIFHETRGGELANTREIPFKMYYGTIDATPLFVSLAGAYLERTGDMDTIESIWPNIQRALYWIDRYGDVDGDGFVEYKRKSDKGLINQGWKDSDDAVSYADGQLAMGPIALCEVQGYCYDAKMRAAEIAVALGNEQYAATLREQARQLKEIFNAHFWSEKLGTYVIALDGDKRPCEISASNAGHCLFSGIATPERAQRIVRRLLSEDMFSGWGIRTLGTEEARYNPMSYHNGSVWPHDNAIIAQGMSRYGLAYEAAHVMTALFETALYLPGKRLPELICGFTRERGKAPTLYPVACSPQAWAVGAVFMLLQSCLGMRIYGSKRTIVFHNPVLPPFLNDVTISNLRIGGDTIILHIRRNHGAIDAVILGPDHDVTIKICEGVSAYA